jgi:hypothetical protein
MLREYGSLFENGAERVFGLAEGQAKHRRAMEKVVLLGGMLMQFLGLAVATLWSGALAEERLRKLLELERAARPASQQELPFD